MKLFMATALLLAPPLFAGPVPYSVSSDYTIRNFRFGSGETLPELRIHYRTVGTPRRDAKLIPTGPETRGHGTHSWPAVWQEHLKKFLAELPPE